MNMGVSAKVRIRVDAPGTKTFFADFLIEQHLANNAALGHIYTQGVGWN